MMCAMPSLSVIIPTHERAEILVRCLEHLERQTIAGQLEVIVVSDGHDAKSSSLLAKKTWRVPLQFFEIEKSQQGVARNRGVARASSPLILFIGDDIFLEPNACEVHLRTHEQLAAHGQKNAAVLGFTTWDPACGITPVMRWLEESGWQFGYPAIQQYTRAFLPISIQERFSYTSHISLPTETARLTPFREDLSLYGWEDIEWGMRLRELSVGLFYEPNAKALHAHHLTLEDSGAHGNAGRITRPYRETRSCLRTQARALETSRSPSPVDSSDNEQPTPPRVFTGNRERKTILKSVGSHRKARPSWYALSPCSAGWIFSCSAL